MVVIHVAQLYYVSSMRIDISGLMPRLAKAVVVKRATNISLSQDVYADAKSFGINVSQVCEQALRSQIDIEKGRRWAEEHVAFADAYNKQVEDEGLPLAQWRSF